MPLLSTYEPQDRFETLLSVLPNPLKDKVVPLFPDISCSTRDNFHKTWSIKGM
jgi:hypothetical protein